MKFCPFTQKDCSENCKLYINGKCSISVIAEKERDIFDTLDEVANYTANIAAKINDKLD